MAFAMFSAQSSPIAIDFGSSSVKLLQIGSGERPALIAGAELSVPDSIRSDPEKTLAHYAEWLPKTFKAAKFKGKRVVIAVPSSQTLIQHMQLVEGGGISRDTLVKAQLQTQIGVAPDSVVVRALEVGPVHRNGQACTEIICLAIGRDTVMRYIDLLKRCKLDVVGVHTETLAMVRAFDHLCRRDEDANVVTMFVDLGWNGTRVAITHGKQIVFSRYIQIGGKHFDQLIGSTVHCDLHSARAHRLSLQTELNAAFKNASAGAPAAAGMAVLNAAVAKAESEQERAGAAVAVDRRTGQVPPELQKTITPGSVTLSGVKVDMSELLDTVTDELSMCLRYHQGLFKGRAINRVIFLGGEARQNWLCQHIVKVLRLPAQMGDPLARLDTSVAPTTPGLTLGQPQPGWAVACGLCTAPTDL